jgi:hypothetical protein
MGSRLESEQLGRATLALREDICFFAVKLMISISYADRKVRGHQEVVSPGEKGLSRADARWARWQ